MRNKKSNLLIIYPTFFFQDVYHKDLFYSELPLKSLQISALLKKKENISIDFLDLRFEEELSPLFSKNEIDFLKFKEKVIKVLEHNSIEKFENVSFFLDSSYQYLQTNYISEIFKEEFPKAKIIVGGQHPTAIASDFTNKGSNFNIVIVGEPESVMLDLIKSNYLNKAKNSKQPQIIESRNDFDLNLLPFPDYLSYLNKYNYKNKFNFTIHLSRGCPFNCSFCKIMRTNFRNFSFIQFIKRFEKLQRIVLKYNNKLPKIGFLDQSFNSAILSNKILKYIIKNNLQEIFKFTCQTRIEIVYNHKEILYFFKKAGMVAGFGFESANENLLIEMNKTRNPGNYFKKMKKILEFYKTITEPYCRINTLAGFPGENAQSFQDTINFLETYGFHENIQISPSLFINDPITPVYNNMSYFEEKYGTKFKKEWWNIQSDPLKNSVLPKPSKNYTKAQLIKDYKDQYIHLLTKFKLSPFEPLINWKNYFNKWEKALET